MPYTLFCEYLYPVPVPYTISLQPHTPYHTPRVDQNHTFIGIYGVYTVFWAGKSPYIWSYTVCIYGSGQPYIRLMPTLLHKPNISTVVAGLTPSTPEVHNRSS